MLPNESLLQVLHFADYKTLILAKLAGAPFLRVAKKFAAELACRHSFRVAFYATYVLYDNVAIGAERGMIHYANHQPSVAAACQELDEVIGPHSVAQLSFFENTWNMPGVRVIFDAAPPLKYAEEVRISCPNESTMCNRSEAFMRNFSGLKSLCLWLNYDVFRHFSWNFLQQESARELRLIKVAVSPSDHVCRSVEELVRYCVTLPQMRDGEPLELDFAENSFTGAFGLRIIELLKGAGRAVTFRMRFLQDVTGLELDESEYKVDVDGTTTRYTSDKSGIVVEVQGRRVTIQSTAEVPPKKPRTSADVLPVIPFNE